MHHHHEHTTALGTVTGTVFTVAAGENGHTDHPKTEYTDQSFSFA